MKNNICINLGTYNTTAAIMIDGKPTVVRNGESNSFPTVACVMPDKKILVCQDAEPYRKSLSERFVQEFKLKINEPFEIDGIYYVDIVAAIFCKIKESAQAQSHQKTFDAVALTIPTEYTENSKQKEILKNAAEKAGFDTVEFVYEQQTIAQYFAYITESKPGLSLIYDLGGCAFNAALVDISEDRQTKILCTEKESKCGGLFFDSKLYKFVNSECQQNGNPLNPESKREDYAVCKNMKETLSAEETVSHYFFNGQYITISKDIFNGLIKDDINLTIKTCDNMLRTAGKQWTDVNQILLSGGSVAIPLVTEMLKKHLSTNGAKCTIVSKSTEKSGKYDHNFAICMGGLISQEEEQPIAKLYCDDQVLQLKKGINTFGRDESMDFHFDDKYMSRKHFTIEVTKNAQNEWTYIVATCSETRPTIVNMEQLDLQNSFTREQTQIIIGQTITAGHTKFKLTNK